MPFFSSSFFFLATFSKILRTLHVQDEIAQWDLSILKTVNNSWWNHEFALLDFSICGFQCNAYKFIGIICLNTDILSDSEMEINFKRTCIKGGRFTYQRFYVTKAFRTSLRAHYTFKNVDNQKEHCKWKFKHIFFQNKFRFTKCV